MRAGGWILHFIGKKKIRAGSQSQVLFVKGLTIIHEYNTLFTISLNFYGFYAKMPITIDIKTRYCKLHSI